ASTIYRFIWGELCDWYLELVKPTLYGADEAAKAATRRTLVAVLDQTMRLLHPFMPFISEEIWQALPMQRPTASIMIAPYPQTSEALRDSDAEARIGQMIEAVTAIRNIRAELGIPPSTALSVRVAANGAGEAVRAVEDFIKVLAKVNAVEVLGDGPRPHGEPSAVVAGRGGRLRPPRGGGGAAARRPPPARPLA